MDGRAFAFSRWQAAGNRVSIFDARPICLIEGFAHEIKRQNFCI